ncbi:fructosamine kinase [Tamlana nanhaiensis]|uniref:Fructosamine kinase n=1 Tax=Neotamlana nanhaiensis TaxID=1382798 RepID=A0A0D7W3P6_9FLAO|nr:fructosamine kinase family protein [Tamlana nanhaiensis]KJD33318.1 fructosamine kinase [Tamlana nanhaiensis]
MQKAFLDHIASVLNETIINYSSVSGGDISEAFKIETSNNSYFLKVNTLEAKGIFEVEKHGLETIKHSNTIATPKVIYVGNFEENAYLILEFIETKQPNDTDFNRLGEQLAKLHSTTANTFGLETNNFIGSLPQQNHFHDNWTDFYINERLLPQLHMAKAQGLLQAYEIPSTNVFETVLTPWFENIKPALLHGDLWSGNFLISKDGTPFLIDPAVYYGHNEVDIALSKLFGGFNTTFYSAYQKHLPFDAFTNARIEIYQLYYLLVHLNLFGRSYYTSVKHILTKYF